MESDSTDVEDMEVDDGAGAAEEAMWEHEAQADRTAGGAGSDGKEDAGRVAWFAPDEGQRDAVAVEFYFDPLPRQSGWRRGRRQDEQWAEVHAELEDSTGRRRWVPRAMSGVLLWRRGGGEERWFSWDGKPCKHAYSAAGWLQVGVNGQGGRCHVFREEFKSKVFCGTDESWRHGVQNCGAVCARPAGQILSTVAAESDAGSIA